MTSPGGDVPEGAYVGTAGQSNSIARLSDISEESAKSMMQGAAVPSFNRQRDAAWGVFNDIAYAITGVQVDENGNPITHIQDWATRDLHNLGTVIADYGDALDQKVEPWAVPTVAPLSQTINRRADPTFGLSDFFIPRLDLAGNTRGADGHFHALTGDHANAGRVERRLQVGANTKGRIYFAFITPAINRAYEQLNFMVSAVTNPCQMDVGVYVVGEDTKELSRQVYVEDALAGHGIGESVATVTFPTWVATQGSYLAIAFLQRGSGNTRMILGLNETPRPLLNTVFPRKISAIHTQAGWTGLPLSTDGETQVNFEDYWFNPYAELSENVGIDYRVFTESWGHSAVAPRPWVPLTSRGIYSSTNNGGQVYASHNGVTVSMYDTPLSTNFVRVRTSIASFWPVLAHGVEYALKSTTIVIRGTNDLRSGLGLRIHNRDGYSLISWTDTSPGTSWNNRPTIASFPLAPATGQRIEIDYLDGAVIVRVDGVVRLEVTVADPLGASGRFLGLQFDRDSRLFNVYRSSWLGPWSARDLPQANGDDGDEDGDDEGPIVGD